MTTNNCLHVFILHPNKRCVWIMKSKFAVFVYIDSSRVWYRGKLYQPTYSICYYSLIIRLKFSTFYFFHWFCHSTLPSHTYNKNNSFHRLIVFSYELSFASRRKNSRLALVCTDSQNFLSELIFHLRYLWNNGSE